jgi:hypothetical protein
MEGVRAVGCTTPIDLGEIWPEIAGSSPSPPVAGPARSRRGLGRGGRLFVYHLIQWPWRAAHPYLGYSRAAAYLEFAPNKFVSISVHSWFALG